MQSNYAPVGTEPKDTDQPIRLPFGTLTENGKFFEVAHTYKVGGQAKIIKMYEKIKAGIWSYNGYFHLADAWQERNRLIPTSVKVEI